MGIKKKILIGVVAFIALLGVLFAVIKLSAKKEDPKPAAAKSSTIEIASNAACAALTPAKLKELPGLVVDNAVVKPSSNEGADCNFRVGKGVLSAGQTDDVTLMLGKKKYMPLRADFKTAVSIPNSDEAAFIVPAVNGTATAYVPKGDWFVGIKIFSKTPFTNTQIKNLLQYVTDQI